MSKFKTSESDNDADSDNSELGDIMNSIENLDMNSDVAVVDQNSISTSDSSPIETVYRPTNPIGKLSSFQDDELIQPSKKRVAMKSKTLLKPISIAQQGETSRLMIHNKSREDLLNENRKKRKRDKKSISNTSYSSIPDDDSDITLSDLDEETYVEEILDETTALYPPSMLSEHLGAIYDIYDTVEPKLQKKLIEKCEDTLTYYDENEPQYQEIKNLIDTLDPEHFYGKKGDKKRTRGGRTVKRKRTKKTKRTKKAIFKKHVKTTKKRKTRKTRKRKKTLKKQH